MHLYDDTEVCSAKNRWFRVPELNGLLPLKYRQVDVFCFLQDTNLPNSYPYAKRQPIEEYSIRAHGATIPTFGISHHRLHSLVVCCSSNKDNEISGGTGIYR